MIDHLIPDIPRIYSAIAEWLACMIFFLPFKKRFSKIKTGVIMAVMLVVQSGFMVVTEDVSLFFWIPCMMVAVFLMLFFIYVSCAIEITDAVYFVLIAFVVAEFMASIEWQVACYFRIAQSGVWWREWLALILGYGIISVILFKILYVHFPEDGQIEIGWKECLSAFLIAISVFAVSNISYLTINTPFSGRYSFEIANIRTIVDLAGIAILYAHLMQCCEMRARKELEAVQNVLQNQYAQYVQSKESIELINYKYHDLKHQIAVLRSEEDPQKREAFLDEMEAEIRQYEAQNKTGNKVLDTILTAKSIECQSKKIQMNCIADGKILFFAGGTGHPYFSTDTATVLRAVEIEAEAILLAKAVDGIYDSDPKTNPNAVKYDEISIEEVVAKKLAAMDLTASIMCMEQKMPMLVFALDEKDSIINAVHGKFVGTKVTV